MRAFFLTACVTVSALAHAREPLAATVVTKAMRAPVPLDTEAALRLQDATERAQSTVIAFVDRVQRFGAYRSPLYLSPFSGVAVVGAVYGVSFSLDLR